MSVLATEGYTNGILSRVANGDAGPGEAEDLADIIASLRASHSALAEKLAGCQNELLQTGLAFNDAEKKRLAAEERLSFALDALSRLGNGETGARTPALCERCERIDAYTDERCEGEGVGNRHGPVEYHDVEGVPLCAECWEECCNEAADEDAPGAGTEKGDPNV